MRILSRKKKLSNFIGFSCTKNMHWIYYFFRIRSNINFFILTRTGNWESSFETCTLAPLANHYLRIRRVRYAVRELVNTVAELARRTVDGIERSSGDEAERRKFTYECLISCVRSRRTRGETETTNTPHDWMWRAIAPLAMLIIPANYANGGRGRGSPSNGADPKFSWRASILFLIAAPQRHRAPEDSNLQRYSEQRLGSGVKYNNTCATMHIGLWQTIKKCKTTRATETCCNKNIQYWKCLYAFQQSENIWLEEPQDLLLVFSKWLSYSQSFTLALQPPNPFFSV